MLDIALRQQQLQQLQLQPWTWRHRITTPVLANLLVRQLSGVLFSVAVGDKVYT